MEKFRETAETYKRNLIGFSPSSALTASVVGGIDATLTQLIATNKTALASNPQLAAMEAMASAVQSSSVAIVAATQQSAAAVAVANDNASVRDADRVATSVDAGTDAARAAGERQAEANAALLDIKAELAEMRQVLLTWRVEARNQGEAIVGTGEDTVKELRISNSRGARGGGGRRGDKTP